MAFSLVGAMGVRWRENPPGVVWAHSDVPAVERCTRDGLAAEQRFETFAEGFDLWQFGHVRGYGLVRVLGDPAVLGVPCACELARLVIYS